VPLLVVGGHLSGQPLNGQLTAAGAVLEGSVQTAPEYRLHRLDTDPPKPGLVRVTRGGAKVAGELWLLSPAALGDFLAVLPRPMALTQVRLSDGREVVGFTCEAAAIDGTDDITVHGGWLAYLASAPR
jgi:allophanate hydrolase